MWSGGSANTHEQNDFLRHTIVFCDPSFHFSFSEFLVVRAPQHMPPILSRFYMCITRSSGPTVLASTPPPPPPPPENVFLELGDERVRAGAERHTQLTRPYGTDRANAGHWNDRRVTLLAHHPPDRGATLAQPLDMPPRFCAQHQLRLDADRHSAIVRECG